MSKMCGEMGEVMWVAGKLNLVLKHLDEMRQKSSLTSNPITLSHGLSSCLW